MRPTRNAGLLLLGIWLILTGLIPLLNIGVPNSETVLSVVALAAGILIVLGR